MASLPDVSRSRARLIVTAQAENDLLEGGPRRFEQRPRRARDPPLLTERWSEPRSVLVAP
jgi:hypothetical protein